MANAVDAQLLERRVERVLALAARERDEHGHLHLLRLKAREVPLEPERSEQLLDGTGRAGRGRSEDAQTLPSELLLDHLLHLGLEALRLVVGTRRLRAAGWRARLLAHLGRHRRHRLGRQPGDAFCLPLALLACRVPVRVHRERVGNTRLELKHAEAGRRLERVRFGLARSVGRARVGGGRIRNARLAEHVDACAHGLAALALLALLVRGVRTTVLADDLLVQIAHHDMVDVTLATVGAVRGADVVPAPQRGAVGVLAARHREDVLGAHVGATYVRAALHAHDVDVLLHRLCHRRSRGQLRRLRSREAVPNKEI